MPQVAKKKAVQPKAEPKVQLPPLLSVDRERKVDLLIHLITNLDQPIIISGPAGIGKTSFLNAIEERKAPLWIMLKLQATPKTSFESVLKAIMKVIKQTDIYQGGMTLEQSFKRITTLNYRFVLLIDDAALLVPGLLTTLIQYNKAVSVLRVVATLTQQEVIAKTTDHTIDDCHVVVIPKLTKRVTIQLVTHELNETPGAISPELVSPMVLDKIYRLSSGRPGEITKLVPKIPKLIMLMKYQKIGYFLAAGCFVFMLIGILFWGDQAVNPTQNAEQKDLKQTKSSPAKKQKNLDLSPQKAQKSNPTEFVVDKPTKSAGGAKDLSAALSMKTDKADDSLPTGSDLANAPIPAVKPQSISKNAHQRLLSAKHEEPRGKSANAFSVSKANLKRKDQIALLQTKKKDAVSHKTTNVLLYHQNKWVFLQDARKYTLQLMSMDTPSPLLKVINQRSEIDRLKVIKVSAEKYVLLYGSFRSQKAANIRKAHLPEEFGDAWVRSFNDVQKEIAQNNR
ncbi:MAG: ATP-binding protein [Methylococcaceae bacterium]